MIELLQFGQDAIKKFELARRPEDPIIEADIFIVLEKHVGVIATFTQLHQQVVEGCETDLP
jgi:hypothetical protein